NNILDIYKGFYTWIGRPELFQMTGDNVLEYADVFPLIYCKIRMEGTPSYDHVKHLLIDEMQDYTAVQYSVISRLFKCKKTILGDITQVVNPYSGSSVEGIHQVFPNADVIKLFRSYRSTIQIVRFTQRILANPELIPLERNGEEPSILSYKTDEEELTALVNLVGDFMRSGHRSMAIITKTQQQAKLAFNQVRSLGAHLLTPDSTSFTDGVVVTTAHLAKGLEF